MHSYLDHNAGTPIRPAVREAIARFLREEHGNPSSVHQSGQRARRMLEEARERVARLVGAPVRTIVFTSGGTESNNLATFGAASAAGGRRKIVSSSIEHSSVLAPLAELERRGFEVVRVPPDHDGRIDPADVLEELDENTALVTLGLANAEVGTTQDLAPIAAAVAHFAGSRRCSAATPNPASTPIATSVISPKRTAPRIPLSSGNTR